ncbi:MAG: class I SAM-dependent methyltransferase [Candidatus Bipolaricaulia bacterium]
MNQEPIALDAFEALAESYAARVDTKPHNAYYERPATLSLLPEVKGKRVLDAGCGPGVYAEWLADHGAEVVAFDVSPKMVRLAKQRLGTKARILQADLGQPLEFLAAGSFDIVLSALTLDYVRDWESVFREFYRMLRQPGHFVFSVGHPFADFMLHNTGNYFMTELVDYEWRGFGTPVRVPYYRRPLGALINPLLEAGFRLERILEPTPTEQFRQAAPQDYEELSRQPGFLSVSAVK